MTKFRVAINLGVAAVLTLIACAVIHRVTDNPVLRYSSDVMLPIGAAAMTLTAIFFLTARDIDGPPAES